MILSMNSTTGSSHNRLRRPTLLPTIVLGSLCIAILTGCSSSVSKGFHAPAGEVTVAGFKGKTHGGQFPVSGSTVQFYAALASGAGYGAASTPIGDPVTSDASGNWEYPAFTCVSGSDEIYVASTGGNPGLPGSVNNPYIALTAALGPCNQLSSISFVNVNEVTTVATEYALAGLSTDYLHVATSPTNLIGLTNAFATVNNLVDITTGQARSITPAYADNAGKEAFFSVVPYDLINTLANVLASCINTDGATNPACTNLLNITGGASSPTIGQLGVQGPHATNTADAALYIAHNPGLPTTKYDSAGIPYTGSNVTALYTLTTPAAPFGPALTKVRNDYTMTLEFIGGGLGGGQSSYSSAISYLTIDHNGNLWMPIYYNFGNAQPGTLSAIANLTNLGEPLSPGVTLNPLTGSVISYGGFRGGGISNSGLGAISTDLNNNEWLTDLNNCLIEFTPNGTPAHGSPFISPCQQTTVDLYGHGARGPLVVDASNNLWALRQAGSSITSTDANGNLRNGFPTKFSGDDLLGADYSGHVWIDNGSAQALNSAGAIVIASDNFASYITLPAYNPPLVGSVQGTGPYAIVGGTAVTPNGVVFSIYGLALSDNPTLLNAPTQIYQDPYAYFPFAEQAMTEDGNGNLFLNSGNEYGPYAIAAVQSNGTQISPAPIGYTGGSALVSLTNPTALAVDQSGNLWVLNNQIFADPISDQADIVEGSNLTELVGLAAPVNPVAAENAKNGTYGTKP